LSPGSGDSRRRAREFTTDGDVSSQHAVSVRSAWPLHRCTRRKHGENRRSARLCAELHIRRIFAL